MEEQFTGRVVRTGPSGVNGANGQPVSWRVEARCSGGGDRGAVFYVDPADAAKWAGRKVRVTVEAVGE